MNRTIRVSGVRTEAAAAANRCAGPDPHRQRRPLSSPRQRFASRFAAGAGLLIVSVQVATLQAQTVLEVTNAFYQNNLIVDGQVAIAAGANVYGNGYFASDPQNVDACGAFLDVPESVRRVTVTNATLVVVGNSLTSGTEPDFTNLTALLRLAAETTATDGKKTYGFITDPVLMPPGSYSYSKLNCPPVDAGLTPFAVTFNLTGQFSDVLTGLSGTKPGRVALVAAFGPQIDGHTFVGCPAGTAGGEGGVEIVTDSLGVVTGSQATEPFPVSLNGSYVIATNVTQTVQLTITKKPGFVDIWVPQVEQAQTLRVADNPLGPWTLLQEIPPATNPGDVFMCEQPATEAMRLYRVQ